jgi:hypothetical protein
MFSFEANCGETVLIKRSFGRGLELDNNADPVALEKSEGFEYWYVEGIETAFEWRQDAFEMANTWASLQKKMQKQKTFLEGAWSKFTNNQHRLKWGTPVAKFQAYREVSKDLVAQFISDIQGHMTRARDLVDYAKKRNNPFAGIGGVVQEYTELLGDKVELAKGFKDTVGANLYQRITDIDLSFTRLATEIDQVYGTQESQMKRQPQTSTSSNFTYTFKNIYDKNETVDVTNDVVSTTTNFGGAIRQNLRFDTLAVGMYSEGNYNGVFLITSDRKSMWYVQLKSKSEAVEGYRALLKAGFKDAGAHERSTP